MEIMTTDIDLAKNRGATLLAQAEADLASGCITEAQWYEHIAAVVTPAYLSSDTPWGQSGKSGDSEGWENARSLIIDAVDRSGAFLDIGCASGYLMECLAHWGQSKDLTLEPYGLDISPELAELARRRLPHWRDRIFVGNAIDWTPPRRFDFVRTGLEYVPLRRQKDLVHRLLDDVIAPGGRLIVGVNNEEIGRHETEQRLTEWGFAVAGRTERAHRDPRLAYRVLWIQT